MDFAGFSGFENDRDLGAGASLDQMMVETTHDQQSRHRGHPGADLAVGNDEQVGTVTNRLISGHAQDFEGIGEALTTTVRGEDGVQRGSLEAFEFDLAKLGELVVVDERVVETNHAAALRTGVEQVALGAEEGLGGGDQFFADAVQCRVGDLGEDLLEVLVEQLWLL